MFLTVLRAVFWLRPFLVLFSMKSIKKKKRSTLNEALSWYHVSAGFCETPTLPASVTRCLWFPRSPGDQRAGPALCRLRAGGPAAPLSLEEDVACPSPGSPQGGVCVSSAPEAGSGSPDTVTLELDAVRLERDVGRLGTDAGKLGTAELGLSPSYLAGQRLQNLWSQISPSNSGSSLNALPFIHRSYSDRLFRTFVQNLHFASSPSRVFTLWTGTEAPCLEPGD